MSKVLAERRQSHAPALLGALAVHGLVGWALLSVDTVREAVIEAVPAMIVTMIDERPEPEPYVPPPPANPQVQLVPMPLLVPLQIDSTETAAPAELTRPQVVETSAITDIEAPVRAQVPVPPRKTIPASAVEYLISPKPVYPLFSRRAGERGTVMLRVLINEQGLPAHIEVEASSGYARLDEAAVSAMQRARFKPYSEDGVALSVWAPAPIIFEL